MWRFILGGRQGQVNALAGATGASARGPEYCISDNLTIGYSAQP
jgi:hypothetical protein